MIQSKRSLCLWVSYLSVLISWAQINSVIFGSSHKEGDYWGQRAENGEKAGIGILDLGHNMLYAGDFLRNKPEGKGMIIGENENSVSNCKGSYVYVGSWIKGRKEGKGICYDKNGEIIYEGLFSNDKPIEKYPSSILSDKGSFGLTQYIDGTIILSQIKNSSPNGFGIGLLDNGLFWIGKFKNGFRTGTGLMFNANDDWIVTKITNNNIIEITSSEDYHAHKSAHDSSWKLLRQATQEQFLNNMSTLMASESKNNNSTLITERNSNDDIGIDVSNKDTSSYQISVQNDNASKNAISSNHNNKEVAKTTDEKVQQSKYASLNRRSSQKALDAIMDEILDRKNNPEKYFYETDSQYKSKIKRLQKEARDRIKKFEEKTGGQKLAYVESLLKWNP